MKIHILALGAALIGAGSNPSAFAQDRETQQRRTMKSRQKGAEQPEKRRQLLKEIQPPADRYAEAMITRKYSDSLVQGYVSSLGSIEEMQIALVGGLDIFTYNGDNRRPARSAAEYRAIRATGIVTCGTVDPIAVGSGFVISARDGNSIVLTAGHVIRSTKDNTMYSPCHYQPYGQRAWRVRAKRAPKRAGLGEFSDENVRKDWGMLLLDGELPQTISLTQKAKEEIFQLLDSEEALLKLYSRHPNPPPSWRPQIQISDYCRLLRPRGRRDLLASPHILYHTCDTASSSSGGLLALELADGTTEAIGLHQSTINSKAAYDPFPDGTNGHWPRSDRVSGIALSLASDGSMPKELRRALP